MRSKTAAAALTMPAVSQLSNLLYLDSSVFGGAFDEEFERFTRPLFDRIQNGEYRLPVSPPVFRELSLAPNQVRTYFEKLSVGAVFIEVDRPVLELQTAYLREGVVTGKSQIDALHVSLATVGNCRAIVSWNFKHIVQMDRIRLYNAVNLLLGYNEIAIHAPPEIVRDED
jgi:hypothetical protein